MRNYIIPRRLYYHIKDGSASGSGWNVAIDGREFVACGVSLWQAILIYIKYRMRGSELMEFMKAIVISLLCGAIAACLYGAYHL